MSIEGNSVISIITVAYNEVDSIEHTMRSVLAQTYAHIEYIVIDGASTDGTVEIIKSYELKIQNDEFPNIKFRWISEPDKGIYDAMNKGIEMATGEWINFMNAGDELAAPTVVENIVQHYKPDVDIFYGDTIFKINELSISLYKKPLPLSQLSKQMVFGHPASFVKASVLKGNPFDASFKSSGDYNFFMQCYRERKVFHYLPIAVAIFEDAGISSNVRLRLSENARIWGIEHTLRWKIRFGISCMNYDLRQFAKRTFPKCFRAFQKYKFQHKYSN